MLNFARKTLMLAVSGIVLSAPSIAETQFRADVGVGFVHIDGGGYEEGFVLDQSVSYENVLLYRLGYVYMDEIHLDDSRYNGNDAEIEVNAPYVGVGKAFDLKPLQVEVGGGVMFAKTEGVFLGRTFKDDRETSPYLNAQLLLPLSEFISLRADYKYIDDVSGGDLHLFSGGVRFKF